MHHTCCTRSASDLSAAHCPSCGGAILRCAAFEECGGLVDADGRCKVCIAPMMFLDGTGEARVGGALALPLTLKNAGGTGRPLFLAGAWVREAGGDWRELEVLWDRLDSGHTAALPVQSSTFEHAGTHRIDIAVALASRWRAREEVFAFAAGLQVEVHADAAITVQQNITYAPDAPQTGATIYSPLHITGERTGAGKPSAARVLDLMRAAKLERSLGLRGTRDGVAIPRGTKLVWTGFPSGSAPVDGSLLSSDGVLTLGRSRTVQQGGQNDVRLLAQTDRGEIDEAASLGISRHHFSLWIENDRLMLRVESDAGGYVNGERLDRAASTPLESGDVFSPVKNAPRGTAIEVHFDVNHAVCHTLRLSAR